MTLLRATAKKIGNSRDILRVPQVVYVNDEDFEIVPKRTAGVASGAELKRKVGRRGGGQNIDIYETADEFLVAANPVSSPQNDEHLDLAISAAGTNAATATPITKYYNQVDTIVAATADGVVLPATTLNRVIFIHNNDGTDPLDIFPATGDFIDALAVNTAITIATGVKVWLASHTEGKWIQAIK